MRGCICVAFEGSHMHARRSLHTGPCGSSTLLHNPTATLQHLPHMGDSTALWWRDIRKVVVIR